VEEPPFLLPVKRIVSGVEIEGDLRRRRRMSIEKQIDKPPFDRRSVIADLVITGRLRPAQLQPIERRFASQRGTIGAPRFELTAQHRHHRVVPQLIVVDQVLVAKRNPQHPLSHQARHRVFHQLGHAVIGEAAGNAFDQPDLSIGGTQQHRPGLRGHRAAIKRRHHCAPFDRYKTKQIRATLCLHRVFPWFRDKPFRQHDFLRFRTPMHLSRLRNAG